MKTFDGVTPGFTKSIELFNDCRNRLRQALVESDMGASETFRKNHQFTITLLESAEAGILQTKSHISVDHGAEYLHHGHHDDGFCIPQSER